MAKRTALFLFLFFQINLMVAQVSTDSSRVVDTVRKTSVDTISTPIHSAAPAIVKPPKKTVDSILIFHTDSLRYSSSKPKDFSSLPVSAGELLNSNPFFNFAGKPVRIKAELYEPAGYEGIFYFLMLMLFYFAIIKLFFAKYLSNLLTLFFRASMRQQQLREQVLQSPFPSLLLNILFILSGGMYGAFLMRFYQAGSMDHFWFHFLFCAIILASLYLLKFLILRITGWIFNISRAVETYLFVVFMTNKIIGIFLLPFLVLISFSGTAVAEIGITVSFIMVGVFYIYRFIGSYTTLHKEINISGLHFILYLCAFEIAPLLLIYKVLIAYLEKAY